MRTSNDEMLIIYKGDLRELIQEEVNQFRKELRMLMDEVKRGQNLDTRLLSITDVAKRYDVSKATVHNWIKKKLITGFKRGKGRFFYLHELDKSLTDYKYFEMLQKTGEVPEDKRYMEYYKELKEQSVEDQMQAHEWD
ncbi:MAG: hypothetical protein NVS3B13_36060 [Mucilaginibacter sp.]